MAREIIKKNVKVVNYEETGEIITCDCCGDKSDDQGYFEYGGMGFASVECNCHHTLDGETGNERIDLCPECYGQLFDNKTQLFEIIKRRILTKMYIGRCKIMDIEKGGE